MPEKYKVVCVCGGGGGGVCNIDNSKETMKIAHKYGGQFQVPIESGTQFPKDIIESVTLHLSSLN